VLNNPLKYTDPTGHKADAGDTDTDEQQNAGPPPPPPPDRLEQLIELQKWLLATGNRVIPIWREGAPIGDPSWFVKNGVEGTRTLFIDHPHPGMQTWHLNTELKWLQGATNGHYDLEKYDLGKYTSQIKKTVDAIQEYAPHIAQATATAQEALKAIGQTSSLISFPPLPVLILPKDALPGLLLYPYSGNDVGRTINI